MKPSAIHALSYLDSQDIVRWFGTEMALSEGQQARIWNEAEARWQVECGPAVWTHPSVPFLQLTHIEVQLRNGAQARLLSQLDDGSGYYGLYLVEIDKAAEPGNEEPGSIFRTRELAELPVGPATTAILRQNGPNAVIEACIRVGRHEIRLLAAEVYDRATGVFDIVEGDESILLQLDGARPGHLPQQTASSPAASGERSYP
ncbi:hypothetical protein DFR29_102398 [Tahibacter aquaticus]|uniref:Uncharacterized protein n=1 Tax=Tahibacter aquaticus TaxID=520092 RepID=A0A4R6Z7E8_9GAMM|nr:hypothetical protein [Tahibacter aquaticus]TDR47738.1 hypothetical protein DFR29_102398 [Tahibacter aquaticus]